MLFNISGGYILIDNEQIQYTSITEDGNNYTFNGLTRGANSTIATSHFIGDRVTCKKVTLDSKLSDIPNQNDLIKLTYYNKQIITWDVDSDTGELNDNGYLVLDSDIS